MTALREVANDNGDCAGDHENAVVRELSGLLVARSWEAADVVYLAEKIGRLYRMLPRSLRDEARRRAERAG